jgi:polyhydroxyalkanoate synthesis regulator phasin
MSITQEPFSRLLAVSGRAGLEVRDSLGLTSPKQARLAASRRLAGGYIGQPKRRPPASPDGPHGLAIYFTRTMGSWGAGNIPALRKTFSELLKSGQITPNQARAMVDRFATDWKFYPTHKKAPWETFIGRRYDLMEKTKDQKKTPAEKSSEWAEITAKYAVPRRQKVAPNDNE